MKKWLPAVRGGEERVGSKKKVRNLAENAGSSGVNGNHEKHSNKRKCFKELHV